MWSTFKRFWRYMAAFFSGKLDEVADPRVQIEQAIEEAKRQHDLLSQQAAAVIGNQKQLELKLGRTIEEVEKLQSSARQALMMSDDARKRGDTTSAGQYEEAAQSFAMKLVAEEKSMKELKTLHDQAVDAAQSARRAVEQNAMNLQKQLAERTRLMSQLDQAKMQERMNAALRQMEELTPKGDVPTLSQVQEKIEQRYAKALGEAELRGATVGSKMIEVEKAQLDAEAAARLTSLRESLGLPAASKAETTGSEVESS